MTIFADGLCGRHGKDRRQGWLQDLGQNSNWWDRSDHCKDLEWITEKFHLRKDLEERSVARGAKLRAPVFSGYLAIAGAVRRFLPPYTYLPCQSTDRLPSFRNLDLTVAMGVSSINLSKQTYSHVFDPECCEHGARLTLLTVFSGASAFLHRSWHMVSVQ